MKLKKITLKILIIMLLVCTTILTTAIAKNKTKIQAVLKAEIAEPIIELEQITVQEKITESTENKEYYFKVKNYNSDGKISQIGQKYVIEISTENADSLKNINYELFATDSSYSNDTIVALKDNKSEEMNLIANENQDVYYKIRINNVDSDFSFNDSLYFNIISKSIEL